ncbi:MAG: iron-containing alcohol dehydrogenase family protein [Actinomycetota bacterium]|nr:iron-containing alcohol dehydrogenase family protein [Actinomycetota bacterium]
MPLLARTLSAPLFVDIRRGAVEDLPGILADSRAVSSGAVAVAVGKTLGAEIEGIIGSLLPDATVLKVKGGSHKAAVKLARKVQESSAEAIVAIGGGGTIDVAKYAAGLIGLPSVAVATTLTHDGLASPVAVLEQKGFMGSYGVPMPIGVVVDLDFVERSPSRHTRSGIGDAVSNLSAVKDWELARDANGDRLDGMATAIARNAGQAVLTSPHPSESDHFLVTLADSLILSGFAMSVAGSSRPCSGAEHEISHAINALYPNESLHGETVSVGTMFAESLRGYGSIDQVDTCFRSRGLPRVPADLGLSVDEFKAVVAYAPSMRPGRYTLLEHLAMSELEISRRVDEFVERFDVPSG